MSTGANVDPLLLRQLTQRLDHAAATVADEHGLTVDQWRMLERLADAGSETMAGLATALALTGPTTTRVADRLVNLALIYRDIDATDRRKVVLRLPQRGRRVHDESTAAIAAEQNAALVGLGGEDQELLARLLCRATDGEPRSGQVPAP